jgi:hypothetical protein
LLVTVMTYGSTYMSSVADVSAYIAQLMVGIVLLFCACGAWLKHVIDRRGAQHAGTGSVGRGGTDDPGPEGTDGLGPDGADGFGHDGSVAGASLPTSPQMPAETGDALRASPNTCAGDGEAP